MIGFLQVSSNVCHGSDVMKIVDKLMLAPVVLMGTQAQAAVDVTGFTIQEASRPYGLILSVVLLAAIAIASLRRA